MTALGTPDVLAATGATFRQLDYWARAGFVLTEGDATPGSGRGRAWPSSEVPVIALMVELSAAGLVAGTAAVVARGLVERGRAHLARRVDLVRVSSLGWPDEHTGAPR